MKGIHSVTKNPRICQIDTKEWGGDGHCQNILTDFRESNQFSCFFPQKEKEELEKMLDQTQGHLEESKHYINTLRQKQRDEKRERAM